MRRSMVGGVVLGLALVGTPSAAAAVTPDIRPGDEVSVTVCERVDLRVPGPGIRFLEPAAAAGDQISPLADC